MVSNFLFNPPLTTIILQTVIFLLVNVVGSGNGITRCLIGLLLQVHHWILPLGLRFLQL